MSRILLALDTPDLASAQRLAQTVRDHVGGYKVGLELLLAAGPKAVESIAQVGLPVFADAKLHDIPNTVERAAARLADTGARWITAHGLGGEEMVRAAVSGMARPGNSSGVLVVTVLTSMDQDDLASVGVSRSLKGQVAAMARLAVAGGAEGVICSPRETPTVRSVEPSLLAVTPGIRPEHTDRSDQKRVATPDEAIRLGADFLVIGRAISDAPDPSEAARLVAAEAAEAERR